MTEVGDLQRLAAVARQRQDRRLTATMVGIPIVVVLGAGVGLALSGDRALQAPLVGVVLALLVLVGIGAGVGPLLLARRRGAAFVQPALVQGLDPRTRRAVFRTLRSGRPVPPEQLPVARDLVLQVRKLRWLPVLIATGPLVNVPMVSRGGLVGLLSGVGVVLGLGTAAGIAWQQRCIAARTDVLTVDLATAPTSTGDGPGRW